MEEHEFALSDVHLQDSQCPLIKTPTSVRIRDYEVELSEFHFKVLEGVDGSLTTDEDGDLVVKRRKTADTEANSHCIVIKHTLATRLKDVGLQVWSGSLLLCDFILQQAGEWTSCTCIELGAGVGLCGVLLSHVVKKVFVTDIGEDVLKMCQENLEDNKSRDFKICDSRDSRKNKEQDLESPKASKDDISKESFSVRELDWLAADFQKEGSFRWTDGDVEELQGLDIIFAADVVYDDTLTDGLMDTIARLCRQAEREVTVYISVEKRLNFTLSDMDTACPAYTHFMSRLESLPSRHGGEDRVLYTVQQLDADFPQAFQYNRSQYLELWEIKAKSKQPSVSRISCDVQPVFETPMCSKEVNEETPDKLQT